MGENPSRSAVYEKLRPARLAPTTTPRDHFLSLSFIYTIKKIYI